MGDRRSIHPGHLVPPPAGPIIATKACPGLRSGIDSRPPFRHSSEGWNPEGRGEGNVARSKTSRGEGLVDAPPQGSRWVYQNPRCQFAVPSHNSRPPEFVIPAKAGIHALKSRERSPTAIPPTGRPPSIPTQHRSPIGKNITHMFLCIHFRRNWKKYKTHVLMNSLSTACRPTKREKRKTKIPDEPTPAGPLPQD